MYIKESPKQCDQVEVTAPGQHYNLQHFFFMDIMPSGTQEQQRAVMEKPCRPVLLIGVTVNPDKGQGLRATALLLSCISIVLGGTSCSEPAEGKVIVRLPEGKISRRDGKGCFICLFVCLNYLANTYIRTKEKDKDLKNSTFQASRLSGETK